MDSVSNNVYKLDSNEANNLLAASSAPMQDTYYPVEDDTQKSKAASSMLGLSLLGILGAAGIAYGIIQHRKTSSLKSEIGKLRQTGDDAAKKLKETEDKLKTKDAELANANKKIEELKNAAATSPKTKPSVTPSNGNNTVKKTLKSRIKDFFNKCKFWKK